MRRLLGLFPGASGQTLRFRPDEALEFQIQSVVNGRASGPAWPDGPPFPAERVAEVQRVIDGAEKDDPVGVVYLRRIRAPAPR